MDTIELVREGGVCTPLGFSAGAVAVDVKGNKGTKLDFAVLLSDVPCNRAAVFTTNLVTAAPVKYCKDLIKEDSEIWGIVVNSGNANACTGTLGYENCVSVVKELEAALEIPDKSLLAASTGVIGQQLPVDRLLGGIAKLAEVLDDDQGSVFAKAIMTTDTFAKEAAVLVVTDEGSYVIGGACKGAGMIEPSMATMLGFLTTDAKITDEDLHEALKVAVEGSFNSITIDGDMSTNDSLFILASGMSDVGIRTKQQKSVFHKALSYLCKKLALMIVKDGEGATKCVTIEVSGALDDSQARLCAAKIANSPLVKTMFAGCDPNWGRLMSSAGASGAKFDPDNVKIFFNNLQYVNGGVIIDPALEGKVAEIMKDPEYKITLELGAGDGKAVYYTCDLTAEYVNINADYRS